MERKLNFVSETPFIFSVTEAEKEEYSRVATPWRKLLPSRLQYIYLAPLARFVRRVRGRDATVDSQVKEVAGSEDCWQSAFPLAAVQLALFLHTTVAAARMTIGGHSDFLNC